MKAMYFLTALICALLLLPACGDDDDGATDGGTDTDTDADTDTDTDADSDSDTDTDTDSDSDSDSDADVGEECEIDYMGFVTIVGECGESVEDCPAGVLTGAEQGTCMDGLACCVAENECTEGQMSTFAACTDQECIAGLGFNAGCPDDGWCCIETGDNDGGDVAEGEDCIVSLIPDMAEIAGTCQTDGSDCEGGYIEGAESGNCQEGLDCCIATNQCELLLMGMAACQETECTSSFGFQAGCPGGQWCCSVFK